MITIILFIIAIFLFLFLVRKGIAILKLSGKEERIISSGVRATSHIVLFLIIIFGINQVWHNFAMTLDSLRTPEGMLSIIGVDPVLEDVMSYGDVNELGIPSSPRQADGQLMLDNIEKGYNMSLYCMIGGIALLLVYLFCAKMKNLILQIVVAVLSVITFFAVRTASAGIIHLGDFCFSGVFNPYTGDLSDSRFFTFLNIIGWLILAWLAVTSFTSTNRIINFQAHENITPSTNNTANIPVPPPMPVEITQSAVDAAKKINLESTPGSIPAVPTHNSFKEKMQNKEAVKNNNKNVSKPIVWIVGLVVLVGFIIFFIYTVNNNDVTGVPNDIYDIETNVDDESFDDPFFLESSDTYDDYSGGEEYIDSYYSNEHSYDY